MMSPVVQETFRKVHEDINLALMYPFVPGFMRATYFFFSNWLSRMGDPKK